MVGAAVFAVVVLFFVFSEHSQFVAGGALINAGLRLQDRLHAYDFGHHAPTPEEIWAEFKEQNALAAKVRTQFPRSTEHPLVALLLCMDARLDSSEFAGDTRRYYYVVRTAGSVLGPEEQEMLELAVINGVKVLVLTRHTDCAAEKAAADPELSARFPVLTAAVHQRHAHLEDFLRRPEIASRIKAGTLLVQDVRVDTQTARLLDAP